MHFILSELELGRIDGAYHVDVGEPGLEGFGFLPWLMGDGIFSRVNRAFGQPPLFKNSSIRFG